MALQFVPFSSEIELPFYSVLSTIKIDHDRLDETSRSVLGLYEPRNIAPTGETCRMQILGNALTSESVPAGFVRAEGKIKNVNTLEAFKDLDKTAIIQAAGKQVSCHSEVTAQILMATDLGCHQRRNHLLDSLPPSIIHHHLLCRPQAT